MVARKLISVLVAAIFSLSLVTYAIAGGHDEKKLDKVEEMKIEKNKEMKIEKNNEGKKADLKDDKIIVKLPEELLMEDLEDLEELDELDLDID